MMRMERNGFTLVEALVTIVLLSVVLLALAPVLLQAVERQRTDSLRLERSGVLVTEANRLLAIPFTELDAQSDFTIDEPYVYDYAIDITVSGAPGPQREITVVVTPSGGPVGPDSVKFTRTQP